MIGWTTSLLLGLCATAALAQDAPVVVGATVAQTGAHASLGTDYGRGLLLWQDEINAAGGLLGRRVELRLLDDQSQAVRARELYRQLIHEHKADLLIGPYGSAATLLAAAEAERAKRVLINAAGPARTVHRRSPKFVFQSVAPYSSYSEGILDLAARAGCRVIHVAAGEDAGSADMAEAAVDAARRHGLELGPHESAQGWIVFGEPREARETVTRLKRLPERPGFFFYSAAAQPRFVELVGRDAEGILGVVRYDVRLATAANPGFVKAFSEKWSASPGAAAAEGYTAATVLAEGVRRAGTLDQQKLRAALAALETATVLGPYKVDPASGSQVGAKPAVAQIVNGRPEIVWPPELKTMEANLKCH